MYSSICETRDEIRRVLLGAFQSRIYCAVMSGSTFGSTIASNVSSAHTFNISVVALCQEAALLYSHAA